VRVPPKVGSQVRIGVAISIPAPYSEALTRARIEAGDPEALVIAPHITLMPPTAVEPEDLDEVRAHLRGVAQGQQPFVVSLAGTDTFRPVSPVVFVAVTEGADACAQLHDAVNAGPIHQQPRFPYHPHVTVAHHVADELLDRAFDELADFEAQFDADHFLLYVHDAEAGWQPTREFPLTGGQPG
jgi:2'-5' RNA ligase